MARFVLPRLGLQRLKTLAGSPPPRHPFRPSALLFSRSYITEMRRSALRENLLRALRTEIAYESESRPPSPSGASFHSFSVDDRPGEQWIRLRRNSGGEDIKIDATMFDGAAPASRSGANVADGDARLHISLAVEVSKGPDLGFALQFVCSAWPDEVEIERVFPVRPGPAPLRPYMGPLFRELDEEMQCAVREFLEERGVNDELAGFLHDYMGNKDRTELLRWLGNVETYVKM